MPEPISLSDHQHAIPVPKRMLSLLLHAQVEPQVLDLPADSEFVTDYLGEFDKYHPEGNCRWVWGYIGRTPPKGWIVLLKAADGHVVMHEASGVMVYLTGAVQTDGEKYLHMAVSTHDGAVQPPFYAVLGAQMSLLPGMEGYAPLPPIERQPTKPDNNAIHVFFPIKGAVLPDFRERFGGY